MRSSSRERPSSDVDGAKGTIQQNIELRRRLDEEHSSYRRKLQEYQDEQQRQAQLTQKLQAKVIAATSVLFLVTM